jgi:hypothetical protein
VRCSTRFGSRESSASISRGHRAARARRTEAVVIVSSAFAIAIQRSVRGRWERVFASVILEASSRDPNTAFPSDRTAERKSTPLIAISAYRFQHRMWSPYFSALGWRSLRGRRACRGAIVVPNARRRWESREFEGGRTQTRGLASGRAAV